MMSKRRILCVPLIGTTGDVYRDSEFIAWYQFAREWEKQGHTTIIVVPKNANLPKEYQGPGIFYLRSERWFPYYMGRAYVDSDVLDDFNVMTGKYQVDVLLTSRTAAAITFKRLLTMGDVLKLPVFLIENWVQASWKSDSAADLKLRAASYSEVDTFFPTQREFDFGMEIVRRYVSSNALKEARERARVRSQGVPLKKIRQMGKDVEKFPNPTLLFAARFNGNKQWDKLLRIYEDIAITRPEVRVKVVKLGGMKSSQVDLSFFQKAEILDPLPVEEYQTLLAKSWISASMSLEEGFSLGFSEQVATGNPVLFPDKEWVYALVGKDWPLIYQTDQHLRAMLEWTLDNYEAARELVREKVDKYVAKHDIATSSAEVLARAETAIPGSYCDFVDWVPRLHSVLDKMPDKFTMMEFVKAGNDQQGFDFGTFSLQHSSVGNLRNLYYWLQANADTERALEPTFVRK